jgi:hypothetical protein
MMNHNHTPHAKFLVKIGFYIGLASVLLLCNPPEASSQSWQPAARLWGMKMQPYVLHTPGHPPLIPMSKAGELPGTDTFAFYAIPTLKPGVEAYGDLHGIEYITATCEDFTGNGKPEVSGERGTSIPFGLLIDAYTETERLRDYSISGSPYVAWHGDPRSGTDDCDGDGIRDIISVTSKDLMHIGYGDADEPLLINSVYPYQSHLPNRVNAIAAGLLAGVPHLLTYYKREEQPGKWVAEYILEELNAEDVRSRRDTIRARVVDSEQTNGNLYGTVIITFDSLWHLPAYWSSSKPNTSLRVTRQGLEVVEVDSTAESEVGTTFGGGNAFGQIRVQGTQAVRINGARQYLMYYPDTCADEGTCRWMEMRQIVDPQTLATHYIGTMDLADDPVPVGGMRSAALTPDLDGDGMEDALIHYIAADPETSKAQDVVDLFLTTQRVGTSVSPSPKSDSSVASARLPTVRRLSTASWQVTLFRVTHPIPPEVRLVDVRGREAGRARLTVQSFAPESTVINLEVVNVVYPVWAQIGNVTIRLQ